MNFSRFIPLVFFALAATAPALLAAETFEGRVQMKVTAKKDSYLLDYAMKEGRMRFDLPGQGGDGAQPASIVDFNKREMLVLMPEQKMFMRQSLPEMDKAAEGKGIEEAEPKPTGKTEKILGHVAEQFLVKDPSQKGETELWLAKGIGTFFNPPAGFMGRGRGKASAAWEKFVREGGYFPLRTVSRDEKGKEISRMEAVKIDKQTLPDSLFQPPAGYQEFNMGGMGLPFGRKP